jgi:beta-lactamase superfamily II metal-dependent hydrolase
MTLLTLEALNAEDGDCLLIHHGSKHKQAHILIDGGRKNVFARALRPRLEELRDQGGLDSSESLPIELAVLSHVDEDHVAGLQALTGELRTLQSEGTLPWKILRLWMNSFDEELNNDESAAIEALSKGPPTEIQATAASVKQGIDLRKDAEDLEIRINREFPAVEIDSGLRRFAARPDDRVMKLDWNDLEITLLAPSAAEMKMFEEQWDRALRAMRRGKKPDTDAHAINGASIVLLIESKPKDGDQPRRLLLTGDGYAEHILAGLEVAGLLDGHRPFRVDVFKVQHHGAEGNNSVDLFEKVHARHYVISPNAKDENPHNATLDRLWEARGADRAEWTLHVTFAKGKVPAFDDWCRAHPGIQVEYRVPEALGISIELGDEHL